MTFTCKLKEDSWKRYHMVVVNQDGEMIYEIDSDTFGLDWPDHVLPTKRNFHKFKWGILRRHLLDLGKIEKRDKLVGVNEIPQEEDCEQ